jgi:catechol 2,3-dioxygenase-like lactoylglutathione lyase family enzyme
MKFNHQALLVNDLNQSGYFYKNILGFEEIEVGAGQNPPKRWFKSDDGMEIHLISTNKKLKSIPKGVHMAFSVKNFDLFIDSLSINKVKYSNWIGNENQIQIRKDGYKQVFFQDPQGYWIEINNVN